MSREESMQIFQIIVLGTNTAFRASLYVYKSNVHSGEAVYITLRKLEVNKPTGSFDGNGDSISLHHCEIMKFVLDYN